MNISIKSLVNIDNTIINKYVKDYIYPWEVIRNLSLLIQEILSDKLALEGFNQISKDIWIGNDVYIEKTALIMGPAIIGHNSQVRHSAFIRENVIIGNNCVVGNSTELKNSVLFNFAQAPHFNYVGDSIMGYAAHIGAGVILSNFKSDGSLINCGDIPTGLNKFGSVLGDHAEIGCNSVLFPGTVVGKNSIVYPLCRVRGRVAENVIYKDDNNIVARR